MGRQPEHLDGRANRRSAPLTLVPAESVARPQDGLPSLTGLRGVAAVVVVLYHAQILRTGVRVGSGIARGYLAVDLFFLLSGFVLAHVYGARIAASPWREIGPFFWARFAKIYPIHL